MTDIPVIFSAPMVLALLREVAKPGTGKTMTRRLAWRRPMAASPWQFVKPCDRLWVKENFWRYGRWVGTKKAGKVAYTFQPVPWHGRDALTIDPKVANLEFAAENDETHGAMKGKFGQAEPAWHLRPNIFLPREHSRLTLVVTETKVEPLHKISRADVLAEGVPSVEIKKWEQWLHPEDCPGKAFGMLWDSIHGKGEWDKNPDVVALRFSVHKVNVDAVKEAA